MNYTIKLDVEGRMARQCIDMAVHHALERYRDELGDNAGLTHRIAAAAAATAMEQFKSWCNAELRLIEADHERRANERMLTPLRVVIPNAEPRP
jgi:hypothetical protein